MLLRLQPAKPFLEFSDQFLLRVDDLPLPVHELVEALDGGQGHTVDIAYHQAPTVQGVGRLGRSARPVVPGA